MYVYVCIVQLQEDKIFIKLIGQKRVVRALQKVVVTQIDVVCAVELILISYLLTTTLEYPLDCILCAHTRDVCGCKGQEGDRVHDESSAPPFFRDVTVLPYLSKCRTTFNYYRTRVSNAKQMKINELQEQVRDDHNLKRHESRLEERCVLA